MKLATTTGDYFKYTNSQKFALEHIRKAGFKYADYNFCLDCSQNSGVFSENYKEYIESINNLNDKLDLKLVQAHAPMGKPLIDGGELLNATLRCIDACAEWNIPNIVVHSGYAQGLSKEQTFEENKKFFLPLLERAEKYNINILVENFNRMCVPGLYWIDNARDLLALIEIVNHPLFHAVWDIGHANLQEMPQDEELKLLSHHVRAFHIHDNMGDNDSHLAPFLGTVNLDAVINGMFDIGYKGYFTFEVGRFFVSPEYRRKFDKSKLLESAPIELRDEFEKYLYQLGKCVLEKYNCFEE